MNIVQEIWNNVGSLQKVSSILQWVSFCLIFIGLLSGVSKYFIDQREKQLMRLVASVRDTAQAQKVQHFETTVTSLESELKSSKHIISDLEKRTVPVNLYKQLIRTASATIEVIISSKDNINTTYMDQGGYLAFTKGQDALLVVSATSCLGKQIGSDKVLYRGVFDLDATSDATRKQVLFLKDAEYLQIGFKPMPEKQQVLSGKAIVTINNSVRVEFIIPSQMMTKDFIIIPEISKYLSDFKE